MSESNGFLSRDELLAKCARRYVQVPLPDGSSVRIQSLSEKELAEFEAEVISTPKPKRDRAVDRMVDVRRERMIDSRRRLIAICLVDAEGKRIFTSSNRDLDAIGQLDAAITNIIADACRAHIGADEDYFKELAKNSEQIHVGVSPTFSPPE